MATLPRNMQMVPRERLRQLDEADPAPTPSTSQDAPASGVKFDKPFTPQQKAKQKAALVDALRKRSQAQD